MVFLRIQSEDGESGLLRNSCKFQSDYRLSPPRR